MTDLTNAQNNASVIATYDNLPALAKMTFELIDAKPETRKDYQSRIGLFIDFIKTEGLNVDSFLLFKRYLQCRNDYSISTKNKYLTAARIFLKEFHKRRPEDLPADITLNVKGFTQSKKHKRAGLNEDQFAEVRSKLDELTAEGSAQADRLKAIVILLSLQGLRQIEVSRLDVEDVDLIRSKAFVLGKGSDDKEAIDLHPATASALAGYIKSNCIKSGALFVSESNRGKGSRLTTRSIRRIVKSLFNDLDFDDAFVHGLRHYFTTKMIKAFKGDLLKVAKFTRHKSLEMLTVYNDDIEREADLPTFHEAFSF